MFWYLNDQRAIFLLREGQRMHGPARVFFQGQRNKAFMENVFERSWKTKMRFILIMSKMNLFHIPAYH